MLVNKTVICEALKTRTHYMNIIGYIEYAKGGKKHALIHICHALHSPADYIILSFDSQNNHSEIGKTKNKDNSWTNFLHYSNSVVIQQS